MINNTQSALLELIKSSLFGISPELPEGTDFEAVFEEAKAQTVIALAAPVVPNNSAARWQEPVAQNMAHYMRSLFEQTNLIKLFESNNIPLVILKGFAAAVYYPMPQYRTMGDIDFLVLEEDFDKAYCLLKNNGYTFEGNHKDCRDYTFTKGEVVFELHRRYSDKEYDIEDILVNGMKHPISKKISGYTFPALPEYENGLVLLDHIRHHLTRGLGLRQIIDWTMFANSVLSDENYEKNFSPLLKRAGLETFCKVVTKMCKTQLFLPESVTWCDDADIATANQLFEKVMLSGNFGRKTPYQYKYVSEAAKKISKNGFFKTLQVVGVKNFDICKKNKFFRAFAWLFQLFRYIKLAISSLFKGEKLVDDISSGKKESDFNKRLGL